ncbi:hypothetical protein INH39_18870 [Massilia violaceinigra]|uniref:Uncharacterized protein n=1 Tax=Massilia violaceinigra TaxID=2045208 RepID=A0ABY3ZYM5_9BURK|nr:hypothetical protein [Massilia violaceinigra]UOD27575.1 hypothetical protein INH39_18870 [Massilia violaceinigra]
MPTDVATPLTLQEVAGICWPHQATVGHIAVASGLISGFFPAQRGGDAVAGCVLVAAGKYRNGAARQWCRTHQAYWGVKADLAALAESGQQRCAHHLEKMGYALNPPVIDLAACASVTIRHGPDGAIEFATEPTGASASATASATAPATARCAAVALRTSATGALFPGTDIVQVNITPPALLAYTSARAAGQALGCVACARCGHPHLDLGSFAHTPHRRHYCGNCGTDSTHSPAPMISSPIHALCIKFDGLLTIM